MLSPLSSYHHQKMILLDGVGQTIVNFNLIIAFQVYNNKQQALKIRVFLIIGLYDLEFFLN
jgi:hypothetical protein